MGKLHSVIEFLRDTFIYDSPGRTNGGLHKVISDPNSGFGRPIVTTLSRQNRKNTVKPRFIFMNGAARMGGVHPK